MPVPAVCTCTAKPPSSRTPLQDMCNYQEPVSYKPMGKKGHFLSAISVDSDCVPISAGYFILYTCTAIRHKYIILFIENIGLYFDHRYDHRLCVEINDKNDQNHKAKESPFNNNNNKKCPGNGKSKQQIWIFGCQIACQVQ